jgi:hypothetical protein
MRLYQAIYDAVCEGRDGVIAISGDTARQR